MNLIVTERRYSLKSMARQASVTERCLRKRCERLWPWHRGHWQLTEEEKSQLEADLQEFPPRRIK